MSETDKDVSLIKFDGKLAEKGYDDLLSPAFKKVGQALATIVDITNIAVLPIRLLNEKARLYFDNNLKKYQKRIEQIPEENISEVPPEIAIPILERFKYVSDEELSNAFVNLLTTASDQRTIQDVHPGFISIIDRICPDEARLLKHIKSAGSFPILEMGFIVNKTGETIPLFDINSLAKKLKFTNSNHLYVYLNNLTSLGLIKQTNEYYTSHIEELNIMRNDGIRVLKQQIKAYGYTETDIKEGVITEEGIRVFERKEMVLTTDYGKLFLECVLNN